MQAARIAAALETSNDVFFEVDLADGTIRWSRGIALLLGHDAERIGRRIADWQALIHPEDAERVIARGRTLLPSGAHGWTEELRLRRADGSYAPVSVRAALVLEGDRPTHVVGALTDQSDLREREDELHTVSEDLERHLAAEREERARADLLMRSATLEVLTEWDIRTGRFRYSPNAEAILGHPVEAISDVDGFMRYVDPDDGARQLADLKGAIASGATAWGSPRFNFRRADGSEIALASRGYIVRDDAGQPVRAVGSLRRVGPVAAADAGPSLELTERQRRVLELVRAGRTNKEIAGDLGISEQAAKVQVSKLLRKFGVTNRAALAVAGRDLAAPR